MERVIHIDGRDVPFRATAAIPRLYRIKFGRDIMQDMKAILEDVQAAKNGGTPIPLKTLEVFENVAYLMAKHADPGLEAKTPEEWLDGFSTFSIYVVFPQLLELWTANNAALSAPKKKRTQSTGK